MQIDPLDECMNTTLLSNFVTPMGRIEKRAVTRLTMKSQKRISKAIKRAKMMGIIPIHGRSLRGLTRFPR
jgi:small subunit ribosomal protein S18